MLRGEASVLGLHCLADGWTAECRASLNEFTSGYSHLESAVKQKHGPGISEALKMLDALASVGVEAFDI